MNFALIFILIFSSFAKDDNWQPYHYDKVTLPTNEGITLLENRNKDEVAYSAEYFMGTQTIRTRVLPKEIYLKFKNELQTKIISQSKIKTFDCSSYFKYSNGNFSNEKEHKNTEFCLDTKAASNFHDWYKRSRALLDL